MKFIKLDRTNKTYKKQIILFLFCVLMLGIGGSAEAGKVKDIIKRSVVRSSYIPPTNDPQVRAMRNRIFYSPLETVITGGPNNNSYVQNTKVDFTLDGWELVPFKKISRFEVWLIGYDGGWKEVSSAVSYNLPPGQKTYTLLARAKNGQGEYDATAAVRTFGTNVSPYFKQVNISGVDYRGASQKSYYEKITLTNNSSNLPINITGWTINTKRNNFSFSIPAGTSILSPRDNNNTDPIVLGRGNSATIYVGKISPVGVNFQENACTQYYRSAFESYDALSGYGSCPLPDPSAYNNFGLACRQYVRSISGCSIPKLTLFQFANDSDCRDFIIKNYNYEACVGRARNSASFYSGRWHIYLGRNYEILDDLNDAISLYDNKGLLVDAYSY